MIRVESLDITFLTDAAPQPPMNDCTTQYHWNAICIVQRCLFIPRPWDELVELLSYIFFHFFHFLAAVRMELMQGALKKHVKLVALSVFFLQKCCSAYGARFTVGYVSLALLSCALARNLVMRKMGVAAVLKNFQCPGFYSSSSDLVSPLFPPALTQCSWSTHNGELRRAHQWVSVRHHHWTCWTPRRAVGRVRTRNVGVGSCEGGVRHVQHSGQAGVRH